MKVLNDITSFIFVEDKPEKADIIFIPGGSWPEPGEKAAELWKAGYAPYVLPSGKYSINRGFFPGPQIKEDKYNKIYKTEWEFMKDVLVTNGVDESAVLREEDAEFTVEVAFNSRKVTDEMGLHIKKAIICCKEFHARRALMLYTWAFPDTEFYICPAETQGISKDNWFNKPEGIERVMREVKNCGIQLKDAIKDFSNREI